MNAFCIDEVKEIVDERGQSYDDPTKDFSRIAIKWTLRTRRIVTPAEVAWCMMDLKASRSCHSPLYRDNRLDTMGYAHCLDLIVERRATDAEHTRWWNSVEEALRIGLEKGYL